MTSAREPLSYEPSMMRRRRRVLALPERDDVIDAMPASLRREVAETWERRAHEELRVATAFAMLCRELLAVGGEPELLGAISRGVHDEVRHAEVCRALAARYASADVAWPGGVGDEPFVVRSDPRLRAAFYVVSLCCVTESIASCFLEASLADTRSPSARVAVGDLLADEVLHARAGWTFLARQPRELQAAVEADLLLLVKPVVRGWWDQGGVTMLDGAPEHGIPSLETTRRSTLTAMRDIVLPGFVALGFDVTPTARWLADAF
jgi:hypothetical protein